MRDYTKPDKCHASIHAALGDPKGLLWHLQQGSSVEGEYNFMDLKKEKLVIITSKYCPRRNINKMFECLKYCNADFHGTSVKEGKTALHMLSENIKLMKKPTKDSIASKYVVWAIDVLIDALLKNKADPNLPTDVSKLSGEHFHHQAH
ncbi:1599_t:CDS:2 [Entrophospora sp. SA101]|nr:1599_t:CDS:2 [Entrophospora sp. SA101]